MDTPSLAALVTKLSMTVQVLAGYPASNVLIEVQLVPASALNAMVCTSFCNAQGAFLPGRGVLLANHLDPLGDVRHRAVLLHELVHEAQEWTGAFADLPLCERRNRREAQVYAVEQRYLWRLGLSGVTLAGPQRWLGPPCKSDGSAFATQSPAEADVPPPSRD
jgi:hypothetical protein